VDQLVATVDRALRTHRFRFSGERELQAGIDQVLRNLGVEVIREAALGEAGTIDFLVESLGVEIKVRGTRADVTRQVHRYLQHESIRGLLLVTTRAELARLPPTISGKPVYTHHLLSGAF